MASNQIVLHSIKDGVARLTLNRPEKRNALNPELVSALKEALNQIDQQTAIDRPVYACVITGAGIDFCAGADLSLLSKSAANTVIENLDDARSLMELFLIIRHLRVPVIAAVKGRALAGGCGLASVCDIVLAAESARFGYPEVKIGFVPAMVMAILRRCTSEKIAFELITRGSELSAQEAMTIGLVNHVYSDATFEQEAETFAQGYSEVSRQAVALSKSLLYQIDSMSFKLALESGASLNVLARHREDYRQGIEKFLTKSVKSK